MTLAIKKPKTDADISVMPAAHPHQEVLDYIDAQAEAFLSSRNDKVILKSRDPTENNTWHDKTYSRRTVYDLALAMVKHKNIAEIMGIDDQTLKKHFNTEIVLARAVTRNKVMAVSSREAINPKNAIDRIFWLKNFGGMSDDGLRGDEDEDTNAEFKVTKPPKPVFKAVSSETIDDMLEVIQSGGDQ